MRYHVEGSLSFLVGMPRMSGFEKSQDGSFSAKIVILFQGVAFIFWVHVEDTMIRSAMLRGFFYFSVACPKYHDLWTVELGHFRQKLSFYFKGLLSLPEVP
jgi:hypothetical protein